MVGGVACETYYVVSWRTQGGVRAGRGDEIPAAAIFICSNIIALQRGGAARLLAKMFRSAAFIVVCIAVAGCVEDVKSPILFSKFVCALCHGRSLRHTESLGEIKMDKYTMHLRVCLWAGRGRGTDCYYAIMVIILGTRTMSLICFLKFLLAMLCSNSQNQVNMILCSLFCTYIMLLISFNFNIILHII